MRLLLYDRVTALAPGESITGIKTFCLSEEYFRRHFSKEALVPSVIFIEAMAQLLGWLIIHTHNFRLSAVMSLIEDVKLAPDLRPGFSAEISGHLISTSGSDSLGSARMLVDGREIASIGRIIYVHSSMADQDALRKLFRYYAGPGWTVEG
ncbi:putative Beta-hydroxyacyl-(Acyl-carrier-protein) dehydratase FabZ [Syntrophobacter sp. SbD1]|nr:putative Beta-hydroxyacyl-(Acyl-carrier-protein) dehydratase FabZ [Syntrophobacter sp. SbD1]